MFLALAAAALLTGCGGHEFTPEEIHEISLLGVGKPVEEAIGAIVAELEARYPAQIREELVWHFNRTGGTLGQMAILYASTKEYVLIFGSPIGSEGFSGRYAEMTVWDCMFAGEMRTYTEGQLEPTVYLPGECAILERGQGKGYNMTPGTWMLEYTRGNIPAALPIGVFAPVSVTADFHNAWNVLRDYAGLVWDSWWK
jgi:C-8 sterol isomerase